MARKKINNRTGERFVNNQGCSFFIVEYNKAIDVLIQFEDEYGAKVHTRYDHCKRGEVKNPYYPSVSGIGFLGQIDGQTPKVKVNGKVGKEYAVWSAMIGRCYNPKYQERNPSYEGCTVCERWLCFANFLEDIELIKGYELWLKNPNTMSLDKDMKQQGVENKIYSLETCKFITTSENSIEANSRTHGKKIKGTNIKTGETLYFNKIKDASDYFNVTIYAISNVLNGKAKTSCGYHWQYVGDNDE